MDNNEYFVTEHKGMALYLLCNEIIAEQNEYNIKRLYTTKHGKGAEMCFFCDKTVGIITDVIKQMYDRSVASILFNTRCSTNLVLI